MIKGVIDFGRTLAFIDLDKEALRNILFEFVRSVRFTEEKHQVELFG